MKVLAGTIFFTEFCYFKTQDINNNNNNNTIQPKKQLDCDLILISLVIYTNDLFSGRTSWITR